jgi:hypothetical protein
MMMMAPFSWSDRFPLPFTFTGSELFGLPTSSPLNAQNTQTLNSATFVTAEDGLFLLGFLNSSFSLS